MAPSAAKARPGGTELTLPRNAERLTIYLEQTEHRGRVPEFVEIVERARSMGLAGATVTQGSEGFGEAPGLHRRHPFSMIADVPVVVTIIDTPEQIGRFLLEVQKLVPRGLAVRQPVEVAIHRGSATS